MKYIMLGIVAMTLTLPQSAATAEDRPKTAAEMGIMQGSPPKRLIDMSKWDKGPDNRWAFQHISEIIPTANISRGSGPTSWLERTPLDLSDLRFESPDGEEINVQKMLKKPTRTALPSFTEATSSLKSTTTACARERVSS